MFSGMRADRTAACASDLRLDAWLAGELEEPAHTELMAHAVGCVRCRVRQQSLARARERFAATPAAITPAWLERERAERPVGSARRWGAAAFAVLATLAAAATLALLPKREPEGDRIKGGEHVSFFVKRGDAVQRGARKQSVQPGDKLRFAYTAMGPRYLAILSIDAANKASVYYPAAERAGARAALIGPGVEVPLASAVELDDVLGEEHVFALFCEMPQALAPLLAQLRATPHTLRPPPGCSLDELLLTKEAAAP